MLLVTLEAIRPDRISPYAGAIATPSLQGLASSGVVFEDVTTPTPMGRPALATLMTGVGSDRTGVRDERVDRLASEPKTLASTLSGAGIETAAFVSSPLSGFGSGLERAFVLFDAPEEMLIGPRREYSEARSADEVVTNFKTWLRTVPPSRRFFAWVHLTDARQALVAPPDAVENDVDLQKRYDEALAKVDVAVGALHEALSGRPDVEMIVVGTHGVMLGEDGAFGDAFWLRPETLNVPLIWSGGRAAKLHATAPRDPRPLWLPDVQAGIASVFGLPVGADGHDPFGDAPPADRRRLAWTWATDDQLAWPTLTAVEEHGKWRVFDFAAIRSMSAASSAEPGSGEAAVVARPAVPRPRVMDPDARRRIEAAGVRLGKGEAEGRAPENANDVIRDVRVARRLAGANRPRMAISRLFKLKEAHPETLAVWTDGLFVASIVQHPQPRKDWFAPSLERFPERPEVLHWAAHCALVEGKPALGEALVDAAIKMGGGDADLYYDMACARSLEKDVEGSAASLRRAVEAGYRNWNWMERDPDLANLRASPRYSEIVKERTR